MNWHLLSKPNDIDDVVHSELLEDMKSWFKENKVPSALLFTGPPGTGKTSTAHLLAKLMLGENYDEHNFFETNGSDDRGIDFVRGDLKTILKVKPVAFQPIPITPMRKVVLIDEADGLTPAAQDAARQLIETYSKNALLIFTCNELNKIRPAIQSRCKVYHFSPIGNMQGASVLWEFLNDKTESPEEWTPHLPDLVEHMGGDLRACINFLEALPCEPDALTERLKVLDKNNIEDLGRLAFSDEWVKLRESMHKGLRNGLTLRQMMNRLYYDLSRKEDKKAAFLDAMVAYGNVMIHIYTWPGDEYSFCDYMVATMRKEMI
jgi:replication factor C small subunit